MNCPGCGEPMQPWGVSANGTRWVRCEDCDIDLGFDALDDAADGPMGDRREYDEPIKLPPEKRMPLVED